MNSDSRFKDRLRYDTYLEDEPTGWGIARRGEDPFDWRYLPQPLADRLLHLGRAYSLHHIATLDPIQPNRFNSMQCQSLEEEVGFLVAVTNDPALDEALTEVIPLLGRISIDPRLELVIEWP